MISWACTKWSVVDAERKRETLQTLLYRKPNLTYFNLESWSTWEAFWSPETCTPCASLVFLCSFVPVLVAAGFPVMHSASEAYPTALLPFRAVSSSSAGPSEAKLTTAQVFYLHSPERHQKFKAVGHSSTIPSGFFSSEAASSTPLFQSLTSLHSSALSVISKF